MDRGGDQLGIGALGAVRGESQRLVETASSLVSLEHPKRDRGPFSQRRFTQREIAQRPPEAAAPAIRSDVQRDDFSHGAILAVLIPGRREEAKTDQRFPRDRKSVV